MWNSEDLTDAAKSWDMQLAKRYYDKLFKEYCIADLTHFERNKVGMRWRTEHEVMKGKGQFECGSKHCDVKNKLTTWEVSPFHEIGHIISLTHLGKFCLYRTWRAKECLGQAPAVQSLFFEAQFLFYQEEDQKGAFREEETQKEEEETPETFVFKFIIV